MQEIGILDFAASKKINFSSPGVGKEAMGLSILGIYHQDTKDSGNRNLKDL